MHNSTTPPNTVIVVAVSVVVVIIAVAATLAVAISSITTAVAGGKRRLEEEKYELKKFVMLEPEESVTVKKRPREFPLVLCVFVGLNWSVVIAMLLIYFRKISHNFPKILKILYFR